MSYDQEHAESWTLRRAFLKRWAPLPTSILPAWLTDELADADADATIQPKPSADIISFAEERRKRA